MSERNVSHLILEEKHDQTAVLECERLEGCA